MGKKSIGIFVVVLGALAAGPVHARTSEMMRELDAPCVNDPKAPGLRSCTKVIADVQEKLRKRLACQAKAYAMGCDLDGSADYASLGSQYADNGDKFCEDLERGAVTQCPARAKYWPLTCNVFPGAFTPSPELNTNIAGRSCGAWTPFITNLSGTTCSVQADLRGDWSKREDAYILGNFVNAINCHYEQVKNEIDTRKLSLTGVGGVEGPCLVLAKQYEQMFKATQGAANQVIADIGYTEGNVKGHQNVADIDYCTGEGRAADTAGRKVKHQVQSGCYLSASRANVEAAFMQLAVCEVMTRSQRSYQQFVGTNGQISIQDQVRAAMNAERRKSSNRNDCSEQQVLRGFYIPRFMDHFRSRSASVWTPAMCQ